ncbi:hypothetical protein IAQ61_011372 [Plenodomus lingam]|uniref:uncharacterized protein n=1 Tax=Leptosphaeria maculans TaxID=5022 RepID=UPI00331ABFF2|nr:hypothetical protein IAQ61_011372 [Plenodomus lingam]
MKVNPQLFMDRALYGWIETRGSQAESNQIGDHQTTCKVNCHQTTTKTLRLAYRYETPNASRIRPDCSASPKQKGAECVDEGTPQDEQSRGGEGKVAETALLGRLPLGMTR